MWTTIGIIAAAVLGLAALGFFIYRERQEKKRIEEIKRRLPPEPKPKDHERETPPPHARSRPVASGGAPGTPPPAGPDLRPEDVNPRGGEFYRHPEFVVDDFGRPVFLYVDGVTMDQRPAAGAKFHFRTPGGEVFDPAEHGMEVRAWDGYEDYGDHGAHLDGNGEWFGELAIVEQSDNHVVGVNLYARIGGLTLERGRLCRWVSTEWLGDRLYGEDTVESVVGRHAPVSRERFKELARTDYDRFGAPVARRFD